MNEREGVKRAAQSMGGSLVRMDVKVVNDTIKRQKWKVHGRKALEERKRGWRKADIMEEKLQVSFKVSV